MRFLRAITREIGNGECIGEEARNINWGIHSRDVLNQAGALTVQRQPALPTSAPRTSLGCSGFCFFFSFRGFEFRELGFQFLNLGL